MPTAAEKAASRKRQQTYSTLAAAYKSYDEGVNARLAGNYGLSVEKLSSALGQLGKTVSYQKSGHASTLALHVHYELGRSAEAAGDGKLARDSYSRCLLIRPTFTQASVRLVNLLASRGEVEMALSKARDAVHNNPRDPRSHLLLGLLLDRRGELEAARKQENDARRLLRVDAQVLPPESAVSQPEPETAGQKLPISDKIEPASGPEDSLAGSAQESKESQKSKEPSVDADGDGDDDSFEDPDPGARMAE